MVYVNMILFIVIIDMTTTKSIFGSQYIRAAKYKGCLFSIFVKDQVCSSSWFVIIFAFSFFLKYIFLV